MTIIILLLYDYLIQLEGIYDIIATNIILNFLEFVENCKYKDIMSIYKLVGVEAPEKKYNYVINK